MDPEKIELKFSQKIVPFLKAINKEFPWQMILVVMIGLTAWVVVPTFVPPPHDCTPLEDFLLRRMLFGFTSAFITFMFIGLSMVIFEKSCDLFNTIRGHYDEETLEVKKKVLDDVIDNEILRK